MAFNVETVGTLGSGADHSASTGALAAWELSNQSAGGQQRAVLITSFEDDVNFSGWPSGEIEIVSDVVGAQRTITAPSGGDHVLKFSDANITTVKIEDVICDGKSHQATSQSGIYVHTGVAELTLNRCRTNDCEEHGLHVGSSALLETLTAANCIFNDNDVHGVLLQYVATESTNTFTNCISFGNGADGWNSTNDGNVIRVFENCIGMDNDSSDFETQASTTTTLDSCVSSDTSAEDSGTDTNCAVSKTTYADYFLDHTAGNFTRTQNDSDGFGIAGNASLTPDRDYYFIERANDTIGPFDYILGRQTHRKSLEFAGGYADIGSTLFAGLTAWTITGWVKWDSLTSNTSPFFGNAATYDCAPTIRLHTTYTTSAAIRCNAGNGSAYIVDMYTSGDPVFVNVWHHLAFSYDGTDAVLYVDGVAQTVTEASSTLASQALSSSDTLRIGGGQSSSSAAFSGHQLDARVYDRAITAAEASDLADATKTTSTALDTLAHYKLESGHPTLCFDSSGNEEHGTLSGSVTTDLESPVPFSFANEVGYSSSLKFDGNVVYPAIADHLTFPAAIKTTMSVANDWSLHIDYIAGETTGVLFGTRNGADTDKFALGNGNRCSVQDSTGQINASVSGSSVSGNRDRWVVTWEASGRNLKTWRDGVANTGTLAANLPGSSGTWAMASAGGSLFDSGELIKMQVFATNLSDSEALALSQGTAATTAPYASYDFEDGVGLVVADSKGSAHAEVVKNPVWVVIPRDESDVRLDVRGDLLDFGAGSSLPVFTHSYKQRR